MQNSSFGFVSLSCKGLLGKHSEEHPHASLQEGQHETESLHPKGLDAPMMPRMEKAVSVW
eukprot:2973066-Amphidinium_carterae.1